MQVDITRVGERIREAAANEILPRYRKLADHDIEEKGPKDFVTTADRAMEAALERVLVAELPGSRVLGEEGAHADASRFDLLDGDEPVWIVDPVDGTHNFAHGREPFGTMVALVQHAVTHAAWIYSPVADRMLAGERGGGSWIDGARQRVQAGTADAVEEAAAFIGDRYLPETLRPHVTSVMNRMDHLIDHMCAAETYTDLVAGRLDFCLFYRMLPWDHAPGVFLFEEAGGYARQLDGRPYVPTASALGLIATCDRKRWQNVHHTLVPGIPIRG